MLFDESNKDYEEIKLDEKEFKNKSMTEMVFRLDQKMDHIYKKLDSIEERLDEVDETSEKNRRKIAIIGGVTSAVTTALIILSQFWTL